MALPKPGGAFLLAARALGTASSASHLAFVSSFLWRFVSGNGIRALSLIFAVLAVAGFALSFVGGSLIRHGGRTKARTLGVWMVGASAALAGGLLVFASFGD